MFSSNENKQMSVWPGLQRNQSLRKKRIHACKTCVSHRAVQKVMSLDVCSLCGGAVIVQGREGSTRYYTAVDKDWVDRMLEVHGADNFTLDRLRRAEHIITDLRKKILELEARDDAL